MPGIVLEILSSLYEICSHRVIPSQDMGFATIKINKQSVTVNHSFSEDCAVELDCSKRP